MKFVQQVKPRFALLLNVMRDQLDRFGEIDNTARLLERVAEATTGTVVLNREDPRIARFASAVPEGTGVRYFGLAPELRRFFPSDDDMQTTVAEEAASVAGNGRRRQMTARSRSRQAHRFRLRPPMPMGARRRPMSR